MTEIWQAGVADLAAAFQRRDLDPAVVLEACLDRVARLDPRLNSIVPHDPHGGPPPARGGARAGAGAVSAPRGR